MEQRYSYIKCQTGDNAGVGVYLCQTCNYAVEGIKDSYTIPTCPCCEGVLFTACDSDNRPLNRN